MNGLVASVEDAKNHETDRLSLDFDTDISTWQYSLFEPKEFRLQTK